MEAVRRPAALRLPQRPAGRAVCDDVAALVRIALRLPFRVRELGTQGIDRGADARGDVYGRRRRAEINTPTPAIAERAP